MYSRHEYILVVYHAPNIFLSILQDSIIIVLDPPPSPLSVKTPGPRQYPTWTSCLSVSFHKQLYENIGSLSTQTLKNSLFFLLSATTF